MDSAVGHCPSLDCKRQPGGVTFSTVPNRPGELFLFLPWTHSSLTHTQLWHLHLAWCASLQKCNYTSRQHTPQQLWLVRLHRKNSGCSAFRKALQTSKLWRTLCLMLANCFRCWLPLEDKTWRVTASLWLMSTGRQHRHTSTLQSTNAHSGVGHLCRLRRQALCSACLKL